VFAYVVCVSICAIIWTVNLRFIAQGVKERIRSEVFMHTGLAVVFNLLTAELTVGNAEDWARADLFWLEVVGYALYVPSAFLVASSLHDLKHKGKPATGDMTSSTVFVDSGVYGIVRQPMTLGMAMWSVALVFVFQSVFSASLGALCILMFWSSANSEAERNMAKFGPRYGDYVERVPMWNLFLGIARRRRDARHGHGDADSP